MHGAAGHADGRMSDQILDRVDADAAITKSCSKGVSSGVPHNPIETKLLANHFESVGESRAAHWLLGVSFAGKEKVMIMLAHGEGDRLASVIGVGLGERNDLESAHSLLSFVNPLFVKTAAVCEALMGVIDGPLQRW